MYKITDMLLTPNKWSRPQTKLKSVKGVVVHWVANPGSSAKGNRNYFENRKSGTNGFGSAHYIIDLDGSVIRCLPDTEIAYHVGSSLPYKSGSTQIYTPEAWLYLNSNSNKKVKPYPNDCTLGIECTHLDSKGKMSDATYNTLVELCAELCKKYKLNPLKDLWLHKEVVGWKDCHKWFVDNPTEWTKFKQKVNNIVNQNTNPTQPITSADQWKIDLGVESVKYLAEKGLISDPDSWSKKMLEPVDNWLLFELVERLLSNK